MNYAFVYISHYLWFEYTLLCKLQPFSLLWIVCSLIVGHCSNLPTFLSMALNFFPTFLYNTSSLWRSHRITVLKYLKLWSEQRYHMYSQGNCTEIVVNSTAFFSAGTWNWPFLRFTLREFDEINGNQNRYKSSINFIIPKFLFVSYF